MKEGDWLATGLSHGKQDSGGGSGVHREVASWHTNSPPTPPQLTQPLSPYKDEHIPLSSRSSPDPPSGIASQVRGNIHQNRALVGDTVALQILPLSKWWEVRTQSSGNISSSTPPSRLSSAQEHPWAACTTSKEMLALVAKILTERPELRVKGGCLRSVTVGLGHCQWHWLIVGSCHVVLFVAGYEY